MGNRYLLVPLSYNDETACPKSHKGPRSHVGFELRPPDVSFCACTIGSCFSHASFPSISFCPGSFCHSQPLAAASHARCCLQCVTTGDVSPYQIRPQISGGAPCSTWRTKLHLARQWCGQFEHFFEKLVGMRIKITRFLEKFWLFSSWMSPPSCHKGQQPSATCHVGVYIWDAVHSSPYSWWIHISSLTEQGIPSWSRHLK